MAPVYCSLTRDVVKMYIIFTIITVVVTIVITAIIIRQWDITESTYLVEDTTSCYNPVINMNCFNLCLCNISVHVYQVSINFRAEK